MTDNSAHDNGDNANDDNNGDIHGENNDYNDDEVIVIDCDKEEEEGRN